MQFNSAAFRQYIVMTDMDIIFSVQIKHLKFFDFFYKYKVDFLHHQTFLKLFFQIIKFFLNFTILHFLFLMKKYILYNVDKSNFRLLYGFLTGKEIQIKASKRVKFAAGKALKDSVK